MIDSHHGDDHAGKDSPTEHFENLGHVNTQIDVLHLTSKSPYREKNFIGTYLAMTFGTVAAFAGFIMPATSLALIDADIGPSPNLVWVSLAWTVMIAVGYTIVGRLSDVFGRRWFFTGCSALATVGCIICGTANSVNQIIAGMALIGFGASGQLSLNSVLGELVPVRHRFIAAGIIYIVCFPISSFGPYISRLMIVQTSVGWRGDFWLSLALNAASTICWLIWYHPPKFESLHVGRTKFDELRDIDYGGLFLFTAGLVLFLLGLSWGGLLYPWSSAYVLGTVISGGILLIAFVLYETFAPVRRPLMPMHLFRNWDFSVTIIMATVGGMIYYSINIIFPTMVVTLYTTDILKGGLIICTIGAGTTFGQIIGTISAVPGGNMKYKLMFVTASMAGFIGGVAGAGNSLAIGAALVACGSMMVGILEVYTGVLVTIAIEDQTEIGTAVGAYGSIRSTGGVIATAIYVSILTNRMASNITSIVVPALLAAGLPATSIVDFLTALSSGSASAIQSVQGVTVEIIQAGTLAIRNSYIDTFRLIFLVSVAFGGIAFAAACCFRGVENRLTHDVVRRLGDEKLASDDVSASEKGGIEGV